MKEQDIILKCKKEHVKYIHLQFSDLDGILKSVEIPISQLKETLSRGKWFDGSSIEGFARIAESDMILIPDLETFAILPFRKDEAKSARFICDVRTPDDKPFDGDPRYQLKRNLDCARKLGYEYFVGPELEFFLFKKMDDGKVERLLIDRAGYFDCFDNNTAQVREEIAEAAEEMGIEIETLHHEVSNSQHEIDFKYSDALKAADNVITLKFLIKSVAEKHGLHATFMPKPIYGINGSGMHVHQSLWKNKKNSFYSDKDPYKISKIARSFIAGQLKEAPGICMVLSPLVNSYKRLVPGFEAPVYLSWARINRSALIRVPQSTPKNSNAARIELRSPDPACNPYLAFSIMLGAGLSGVENNLEPPLPVEENIYEMDDKDRKLKKINTLPDSLGSAVEEFEKSELAEKVLGSHIKARLVESNKLEWDCYRQRVSEWEVEEYLEKF